MNAGGENEVHVSMLTYRGFGQKLISQTTAVELARMILNDVFGASELKRQLPLSAKDADGYWIVSGSPPKPTGIASNITEEYGPLELQVSQYDSCILKLTFG